MLEQPYGTPLEGLDRKTQTIIMRLVWLVSTLNFFAIVFFLYCLSTADLKPPKRSTFIVSQIKSIKELHILIIIPSLSRFNTIYDGGSAWYFMDFLRKFHTQDLYNILMECRSKKWGKSRCFGETRHYYSTEGTPESDKQISNVEGAPKQNRSWYNNQKKSSRHSENAYGAKKKIVFFAQGYYALLCCKQL